MSSIPSTRGWHVRDDDPPGMMRWYDGSGWTNQVIGGLKAELDSAEIALRAQSWPTPQQSQDVAELRERVAQIANTNVSTGRRISNSYSATSNTRMATSLAATETLQVVYVTSRTNGGAVASFVLSLLGVFGIGSLLGIILGHSARRAIRQTGESGDGLAVAGLVLGYLGLIPWLVFVIAILS